MLLFYLVHFASFSIYRDDPNHSFVHPLQWGVQLLIFYIINIHELWKLYSSHWPRYGLWSESHYCYMWCCRRSNGCDLKSCMWPSLVRAIHVDIARICEAQCTRHGSMKYVPYPKLSSMKYEPYIELNSYQDEIGKYHFLAKKAAFCLFFQTN